MVDFDHQDMDPPRFSTQNLEVQTRTERVDVAEMMVGALLGYQGSHFDDEDFGQNEPRTLFSEPRENGDVCEGNSSVSPTHVTLDSSDVLGNNVTHSNTTHDERFPPLGVVPPRQENTTSDPISFRLEAGIGMD